MEEHEAKGSAGDPKGPKETSKKKKHGTTRDSPRLCLGLLGGRSIFRWLVALLWLVRVETKRITNITLGVHMYVADINPLLKQKPTRPLKNAV